MTTFDFAQSVFFPIAIGFFGLGCGYFIWGGQALFGVPKSSPELNKSMGMWGFWMPGFMQFITGVYLIVGMTWFGVFVKAPPIYMAGLAFTAYGIHWFAMAHRRYISSPADADGWMAIAFLILSILGVYVFVAANDIPVAIVFIGLSLIYLTEIPARFAHSAAAARIVGLWQFITGIWLMYMTIATVVNLSLGGKLWL
ncbi:MAG TPA: hypothetical protein VF725_12415 [Ktedonobacterales bacterium]|jgi:hypothetical protein